MDITTLLAYRLRSLRDARGYSLEALAERSGVSRSNISLIERGESSPTATVLDRLATGLGVTLAALFESDATRAGAAPPSPLARVEEQPLWTDPASGYTRRSVSPSIGSPLQLVDVVFPAGQRVAYDTAQREAEVHQQIWMIEGGMDITVGQAQWQLHAGDCLGMQLNQPIVYHNPHRAAARYLVALATLPPSLAQRTR